MSGAKRARMASLRTWRWDATDLETGNMDASVEYEIDDRLADEQRSGFVDAFDTGRGWGVWFSAPAGKRARDLRDWIRRRIPDDWTAGESATMGACENGVSE